MGQHTHVQVKRSKGLFNNTDMGHGVYRWGIISILPRIGKTLSQGIENIRGFSKSTVRRVQKVAKLTEGD